MCHVFTKPQPSFPCDFKISEYTRPIAEGPLPSCFLSILDFVFSTPPPPLLITKTKYAKPEL